MGVFLSKPSVTKFSEDGEDDEIGFGVSSMQGWRRGMEDAHVALLDVKRPEPAVAAEGAGGDGGDATGDGGKIRLFGVFDGHGGKEVALFVQEHMAEELVKLQEYKGGDFPAALVRVFHRMDDLLKGAATELLRSQGMLPEEGGDVSAAGGGTAGGQDGTDSLESVPSASASSGAGEEKHGGRVDGQQQKDVVEGESKVGTAPYPGGGGEGGARVEEAGAGGEAEMSAERAKEILRELSEFRSRKNPSDLESEEPSKAARPMLGSSADYDSDEDDEDGEGTGREGSGRASGGGGGGAGDDDDEYLELGSAGGANGNNGSGEGGGGGGRKIKMSDALELFHRILDIRKDQQQLQPRTPLPLPVDPASASGGGDEKDASPCPAPVPTGGGSSSSAVVVGGGIDGEMSPSKGFLTGSDGTGDDPAAVAAGDGSEDGEDERGASRLASVRTRDADEEGEDTFGDSDESEEDDVVVTSDANDADASGGAAGARPRLGLGASLASIVHGRGGAAQTCNLPDHPIQAGCTSVVCLMAGNVLHVANAGDSRAVLCRGGVAVALSHDHKPLSVTEKTRIQRAGGFVNAAGRVNGNLNLSRSIGDLKYKGNSSLPPADQMITAEPDLMSMEVTEEDRFMILACDGVWDCMTSQECVDFVGARVGKMSLSKVCEEVMDACLSDDPRRTTGIGGDNMTCIVVLLDKSFTAADLPPPWASSAEAKEGSDVATEAMAEDEALAGATAKEDGEVVGLAAALGGGTHAAPSPEVVEGKE